MGSRVPDFLHEADMGFTRKELVRGLENAVVPYTVVASAANPVQIKLDHRLVELHTGPDETRVIASMRMPRISVKLAFYGLTEAEYQAFMNRFKKSLHKGGG